MVSLNVRVQHQSYSLGPLEWQVMGVLWRLDVGSVQDVVIRLPQPRSYTTIMTTMGRLFQKGLLRRTLVDRKFLYSASLTRQELEKAYVGKLVSDLLMVQANSRTPEPIMRHILESLSRHDTKLFTTTLAAIETKPRRKRTYAAFPRRAPARN